MALTLKQVIYDYAKKWVSQPSDSGYERHFDTDGEHYLLLWEGTSGRWAFMWDDWDNHLFYGEHVKGTYGLFSFGLDGKKVSVTLEGDHITYPSIESLQEATQKNWDNLPFVKPQKAQVEHKLYQPQIQAALQALIDEWLASPLLSELVTTESKKHGAINAHGTRHFLALWIGSSDAIFFGNEDYKLPTNYDYDGRPRFRYRKFVRFAGLEVGITGGNPAYYINRLEHQNYLKFYGYGTYNKLDDMLSDIRLALPKLKFADGE